MNPNTEIQKPMVQNISCIIPQTQQLGGLYLGNVFGAQNAAILKEYGIRAIITASAETKINHQIEDIPFHLRIDAHDKDQYYIVEHVNDCIHFIQQNRKFTNVFVHCYAGVSRSSAIVAAYLMWKYRWPLQKTISFLVYKRIVAKPNDGFYSQLKQVEAKLNIQSQNHNQMNSTRVQRQEQSMVKSSPLNEVLLVKKPSSTKAPMIQKPQSPPLQIQNFNNSSQQFIAAKGGDPYMMHLQNSMKTSPYLANSQREQKQQLPQNHANVPIPKVLTKRQETNIYANNDYYNNPVDFKQKGKKTMYNDYMSPEVIPTSPRIPKGFVPNNPNRNSVNYSATKDYTQNKFSVNSSSNGMAASKKGFESQEKAKSGSRCIIRPKDLPGYKNY